MHISIIAALSMESGLGKNGKLLWHIPEDQKYFKKKTMGHPVIMGRRTFDSIPTQNRPLPGRTNIVITRNSTWWCEGAIAVPTLGKAIKEASLYADEVFVIGGAQIFKDALPLAQTLYLTHVAGVESADVFFPEFKDKFIQVESHHVEGTGKSLSYRFAKYERPKK